MSSRWPSESTGDHVANIAVSSISTNGASCRNDRLSGSPRLVLGDLLVGEAELFEQQMRQAVGLGR